ncbi:helix-turn-helix domain-containing protein [Avibacterium paragallinarum]|uniref:helix-turn-helix domain-containing protein n=1 Tax=Avibacterium paragallinarum TaxID=728 RepID=UPI00021ACDF0|nr:helix-turn-helix transcriptional regulator [Avibacterium paragallinarum]QIR11480.1 helix-turn-helix transcriptional regulator [Avibacterium paragallinarum]QJE09547.1 helix-turn-helix transcriptional regulator [Avibacterium paragallinarum]QJE11742.1 helix-turn-helix transcriptional regulator [Avibacterium paragallinarum]QJE13941.1 helix-turn-helix transcriptional regulator [Avibacterium paragallinarum]QJE16144.1 helix-turn-helix transcriptional regulator [Avibacterium paragallinarum]
MKVNEKIRFLRESKNWSQEEMASKLGMSTRGYSKIERGESNLTIPKLEKIVEVFDTDILEVMSLGEKNVVMFKESGNNHSLNIINPTSQELVNEVAQLKQTIDHQLELLRQKDQIIELQTSQIKALEKLIDKL